MPVYRNLHHCLFLFLCLSMALAHSALFANTVPMPVQTTPAAIPSLIQSIRFDNTINFCGISVPVEDQQVRERLEKEMLLALWDRPQVILWIKRAGRYFPIIEKTLKENGLPLDLKYVSVIESGLRPHVSSSKSAVGFWQFLRSTGRRYGLRVDSSVDERRNIFKSTQAACRYLKDLNNMFNSYLLAVSAYNMGEYGLKSEIKAQKNNDFFTLYLPLETQRYAFKMMAAKMIFENQKAYGFDFNSSDLYPEFTYDRINFKSDFKIPIAVVAQAADIPFKIIKDYNPELRGYFLDKGQISILIPKGKSKGFEKTFNSRYTSWQKKYQTRIHVVKNGESLIGISKKYRMSVSSLLKMNGLSLKGMIHPGDRLMVE